MIAKPTGVAAVLPLALLLAACPGPKTDKDTLPKPKPTGEPLPPPIPTPLDVDRETPLTGHDPANKSPLIDIMAKENKRWFAKLSKANPPAHFIGYTIHERHVVVFQAEDGVIEADEEDTWRIADVEVRVGTPALDSRHPIQDSRLAALTGLTRNGDVPFGADEKAIAHHLWLETDRRYRENIMLHNIVQAEERVAARKSQSADFSSSEPIEYYGPQAELEYDRDHWVDRIRSCSKRANKGVATRSLCRAYFERNTVYQVNSEGSRTQNSWTTTNFMVQVAVKHDDGMPLQRLEQSFAPTPDQLPSDAEIDKMITVVNRDLDALHKAPLADPDVAPAILEGRAAAVFFHEVFGHRIEGHRQEDEFEGQTFTKQVGKQIMPSWLSVYDDPTIRTLNGIAVNGFYRFDDEAVAAERTTLVDDGVFKGFLMGRNPIPGFEKSNGHGRREPGQTPVSRQGNLVVESKRSATRDELTKQLLAEVKKQGKAYGLLFTDISGGFTQTSRLGAQAFKVNPVMAYRIYPDGREEVVRGVDISGSPLTALSNIISAARPIETFNGMCGAESGWVPVSASAPSLLLRSLEIERSFSPNTDGTVLDPPSIRLPGGAR